ncbi:hypothetical protein Patl1_33255 [Pistacia atlantica]|uniref:Uncharacterized protein n=1 Tax=Pistacia atlantica TaxID=434234 RepID=A0ACC1AQ60_9ROSI|nr:hypothetical protein Patl1_33255 [Pistacia atlantica]
MPVEATQLYYSIRKDGIFPSLASLSVLLECLMNCNLFVDRTLELFEKIVGSGFLTDRFTYGKAVQAVVKLGDLDRGFEIVKSMKRRGVSPNVFVYNVLISGLCKEKKMRDAEKVFDKMCRRKFVATSVTYNSLVDGYSKVGELGEGF